MSYNASLLVLCEYIREIHRVILTLKLPGLAAGVGGSLTVAIA